MAKCGEWSWPDNWPGKLAVFHPDGRVTPSGGDWDSLSSVTQIYISNDNELETQNNGMEARPVR